MFSCFLEYCDSGYEFGWTNYVREEEEFKYIVEEILGYKFKKERKLFYQDPNAIKNLEHGLWKKRCVDLLKKFFSKDGEFSGVITFPETIITNQDKPWQRAISTLKNWCKKSHSDNATYNKDDATGIIVRNYDLENHVKFCKVTDEEQEHCLRLLFKDFGNKFKLHENDQRFLVFNPSEKVLLVIRMVDAKQIAELKNEALLCINEVNIVSFLFRDELKGSEVIVTGLVTYSEEKTQGHTDCKRCDNFIVSSKIFSSVQEFDKFWKKFAMENISKSLGEYHKRRERIDTTEVFQAVGSKILGYLAHLQFDRFDEPILPVIKKTPSGNIEQAELLLDRYQMEIAYSNEKRIWLYGSYGTGKTIVAIKKAELLHGSLNQNEVIYYVIFEGESRLDCFIKEKFKTYEKVNVLRGGSSLSHIITDKVLLKEKKTNTIHLIVDEYNSQSLSPEESRKLYQLFTTRVQFKNSTLLIAVQPLKIETFCHFGIGSKIKFRKKRDHSFTKLNKIMKKCELKYVMRTTVQINDLAKITQGYLNNKSNEFIPSQCSSNISSSHFKIGKSSSESLHSELPQILCLKSNSSSNSTAEDLTNHAADNVLCSRSKSFDVGPTEINCFSSNITSAALSRFQTSHKLTSNSSKKSMKNSEKTVTKFSYVGRSDIGHGIDGPLPKLIELNKSFSHGKQIALIAFILMDIIHIKSKRIAIIHFKTTNPAWLVQLFEIESLQSLSSTDDVGTFLKNSNDNMVLLNNYNTVRGLEFSEILLILDENEYHMKQYIPEAITRCRSNLSILIKPPWTKNNQLNTEKGLVDHWKKNNSILEILTIGFCLDSKCTNIKKPYCSKQENNKYKKEKESYTFYGVHESNKYFKEFHKEIKNNIVPSLLQHFNRKEEESAHS